MQITGTLIQYYHFCKRQLWLHANNIRMESGYELVELGNFIQETTYSKRSDKYQQIQIDSIKIDFYDPINKIIHETKKSSKFHETHIWQLKYYIYMLEKNGICDVEGVLEYPKERKTEKVILQDNDRQKIEEMKAEITNIIENDHCPEAINDIRCKNCSYFDFCYSNEP